jgi:hypothetical protein
MAVDTSRSPLVVTPTDVNTPVSGAYNVRAVRWVVPSGATTGQRLIITSAANPPTPLWESVVTSAGSFIDHALLEAAWAEGFVVTSLPAGTLYIYTDTVAFANPPAI